MKKGDIVKVKVTAIQSYGAFVSLAENMTGLIHISEISEKYVTDVNKYLKINDEILAKVLEVDENKHQVKLSVKGILNDKMNINKHSNYQKIKMKIGFSSIEKIMPQWLEEIKKEMSHD